MLQAARGPLPTLTEAIAGERIRGSWWGHPKGKLIFSVLSEVQESAEVAVCKLVEGKTTVIQAGRQFKKLAENTLDDGFLASPAVAGKALFLRTRSHLYRIEN